jgi:predicted alpha/beta-fold hydrolase
MFKFLNHIDTVYAGLPVKCKYNHKIDYLENKLCLKIIGDIEKSEKVLICLHGIGGNKDSGYINSMINSFIDEFKNDCIIAPDMPGINGSINTDKFWGVQKKVADIFIDDIISYVKNKNKDIKIFIVAFSGSCGSLINYLTDDGNIIRNNNKDLIIHSYLISPTGPYLDCLLWIRDNSIFNSYISFFHTKQQILFLLKKKNFKKLFTLNKSILLDAILSNVWINGNDEYKFNFGKTVKNCDIYLSKYDPITNYETVMNYFTSLKGINITEKILGGHVGFKNFFSKKRNHEIFVLNSIKKT